MLDAVHGDAVRGSKSGSHVDRVTGQQYGMVHSTIGGDSNATAGGRGLNQTSAVGSHGMGRGRGATMPAWAQSLEKM